VAISLTTAQTHAAAIYDALKAAEDQHPGSAAMLALHRTLGRALDVMAADLGVSASTIHPAGGTNKP
jgi:hypothetical protein